MAMTFQVLDVHATMDACGLQHWVRTPELVPILALAGKSLHDDRATIDELTTAAGHLGWRVQSIAEAADGACHLRLRRPSTLVGPGARTGGFAGQAGPAGAGPPPHPRASGGGGPSGAEAPG